MRNNTTTAAEKSFAGVGNLPTGEPIVLGSGVPQSGFPGGTRQLTVKRIGAADTARKAAPR
jgi:hypothetical protein